MIISKLSSMIREYHDDNNNRDTGDNALNMVNGFCYIGTNELITPELKQSVSDKTCHIGVSGWHNFDIAWRTRSNRVILIDLNINQTKFMKWTLEYIISNDDRFKFIKNMINFIYDTRVNQSQEIREISRNNNYKNKRQLINLKLENHLNFHPNVSSDPSYKLLNHNNISKEDVEITEIKNEIIRHGSWLSNDDSYNYIRKLACDDMITIIHKNIIDIDPILQLLNNNSHHVGTFYISNVADYLSINDKHRLISIVNKLQNTKLIWSCRNKQLRQFVTNNYIYMLFNLIY